MHDGMQYDLITAFRGQGQGHEPFSWKFGIFTNYLLDHLQWKLATDNRFLN